MIVELIASLFLASTTSDLDCKVDAKAMLALDFQAFDQDMKGGWRALANNEKCYEAAADLVAQYRRSRRGTPTTLAWHEGQLRLLVGQTARAIKLFNQARHAPNPEGINDGWNPYVDATIAFARGDLTSLLRAREELAALPLPPRFSAHGWPPNLGVIDGLIACYGKPYMIAYAQECRPKPAK